MNIRAKMVLVVLPLIVTPLVVTGLISSLSARNGITGIATAFLRFKAEQISTYAEGQWDLIEQSGLSENETYRAAARDAVASFALTVVRSATERIVAVDGDGTIVFSTGEVSPSPDESRTLGTLRRDEESGWTDLAIDGIPYVAHVLQVPDFDWAIAVAEQRDVFYAAINEIIVQVAVILGVSLFLSITMLIIFSGALVRPLRFVVRAMNDIITTNDLSKRVEVLYRDETGKLSQTFNVMVEELQAAYENVKSYALRAAIAQTKEHKIRTIFQKYVPNDVIDQFFRNPESMLVGDTRQLAILFSDIRSFTSISESLRPDEIVESLNQYFEAMVDAIMSRNGIVDKYIGDAIMAFFGAPVSRPDDAQQATLAALDMIERLKDFNAWQTAKDRPEFKIGIGINFGDVTVGNIGSERKMDYTVIGDMVNVASRLEGLTKKYGQQLMIAEGVYDRLDGTIPTRTVDHVQVKGRSGCLAIYAVKRQLTDAEQVAWALHERAMTEYFSRRFHSALEMFQGVLVLLPDDPIATSKVDSCRHLIENPPDESWTGDVAMTEK
jgi:class 3 adenylate cyclase/HAMP domain-containing protein